ncbi:MAG: phosphatidylserine decarboxylase, partial [Alphaproteobacteria bacterium]|nr:phosphatidylserine decarboxylase [Alphaproteobacteria bacterium]
MSTKETLQSIFVPINRAGWPFIAIFSVIAFALWLLSDFLGFVGIVLTLWCVYFFRDPERVTPCHEGLVVSPADGVVQMIRIVSPPKELGMEGKRVRISIFMNVFDVHVNRIPIGGVIKKIHYHAGKFFNASLDKASEHNERQMFALDLDDGTDIAFVQIAGLIARRILCYVNEDGSVKTGQRFGMIRFGSRVDVYLP